MNLSTSNSFHNLHPQPQPHPPCQKPIRSIFGPPDRQWTYTPSTKTYQLTNSPKTTTNLTIPTTEGPEKTSITIDPSSSAFIIIDMQNFFLDEKCMNHPNGLKAVEPTIKVVKKCRELGIRVIWLNWGLTEQDFSSLPAGVHRGFMKDILLSTNSPLHSYTGLGSELSENRGRCLSTGSWNAEIYPPLQAMVQDSDIHCSKNRMSGLWNENTPLFKTLKQEGIETIFFGGVNTDQCVGGTLVDAYNEGWNCVLVDDCCGTNTLGGKEVFLHTISASYGFVTDSESFVAVQVG